MNKPKPIGLRTSSGWAELRVIGFKNAGTRPYISFGVGNHGSFADARHGYIEDRDIRRLRAWCDDCLKKRKA